jgi:hypothetical protein
MRHYTKFLGVYIKRKCVGSSLHYYTSAYIKRKHCGAFIVIMPRIPILLYAVPVRFYFMVVPMVV